MLQGGNQRRALVFGAGRQQLQDQEILEAIDGNAWHTIRFAGNQTITIQPITFRNPITPVLCLL
ncbi:hypothetical protein D3C80_1741430 [compost metagenome]